MGRSWPGILAVGMLVLAGCSGFAPAGGTPTGTATPAPVPSPPPSPSPSPSAAPEAPLPPGVVDGRVADPGALASAHREALTNASHVVQFEESTWYANGTARSHATSTTRVSRDGLRYFHMLHARGEASPPLFPNATQVVVYAEGEEGYARAYDAVDARGDDAVVRYARIDRELIETRSPASPSRLFYLFGAMELRVSQVRLGNATMYRVVSTDLAVPVFLAGALDADDRATVENATMRALVTSSGFVREYHLNYSVVTGEAVVHGTRSVRYWSLGAATVRRPGWYEEAVDATGNATGNATGG